MSPSNPAVALLVVPCAARTFDGLVIAVGLGTPTMVRAGRAITRVLLGDPDVAE
ncbi:MAG: hypothetical protein FJ090_01675 [Deltaproteobacteria bacterium]|nr:hypothetical protein [Deltaproteobacteria bacterium]